MLLWGLLPPSTLSFFFQPYYLKDFIFCYLPFMILRYYSFYQIKEKV